MVEKQTHSSKAGRYLGKMHTRAYYFRGKGGELSPKKFSRIFKRRYSIAILL